MNTGDKLTIDLYGSTIAVDTAQIAGIVSNEKTIRLPGQSGFVHGLISLRGEPVVVVDLIKAFECESQAFWVNDKNLERIVVVGNETSKIGLFIGSANTYFLWSGSIKEARDVPADMPTPPYTSGVLQTEDLTVFVLDWEKLFSETAEILATEKMHG